MKMVLTICKSLLDDPLCRFQEDDYLYHLEVDDSNLSSLVHTFRLQHSELVNMTMSGHKTCLLIDLIGCSDSDNQDQHAPLKKMFYCYLEILKS